MGETAVPKRFVPLQPARPIPRLHGGLRSDEYPVILQKGEEVTRADARYEADDMPILEVAFNIDGRQITRAIIRRTEIDAMLLSRLRKALS